MTKHHNRFFPWGGREIIHGLLPASPWDIGDPKVFSIITPRTLLPAAPHPPWAEILIYLDPLNPDREKLRRWRSLYPVGRGSLVTVGKRRVHWPLPRGCRLAWIVYEVDQEHNQKLIILPVDRKSNIMDKIVFDIHESINWYESTVEMVEMQ